MLSKFNVLRYFKRKNKIPSQYTTLIHLVFKAKLYLWHEEFSLFKNSIWILRNILKTRRYSISLLFKLFSYNWKSEQECTGGETVSEYCAVPRGERGRGERERPRQGRAQSLDTNFQLLFNCCFYFTSTRQDK